MKTIAEIKTEIATLISDHSKLDDYVGEQYKLKQKARKRIAILKGCMIYLESNPKPEFVLQMQAECNHKIDVFAKRLRLWIESMPQDKIDKIKNPKKYYYKKVAPMEQKEIKDAKKQRETINYILQ